MAEITFLNKYSDINPRYKIKNSNIVEVGFAAIEGSIENIIGTLPGERVFNPQFGSQIAELLFEPINDITAQRLLFLLSNAIEYWEPRIKLVLEESFVLAYPESNQYDVSLMYVLVDVDVKSQFDLRISP